MNYKDLVSVVRSRFKNVPYFNDKRKTCRRIKFYGDKAEKIYKFLKQHYPSLNPKMTPNYDKLKGISKYYSGCFVHFDLDSDNEVTLDKNDLAGIVFADWKDTNELIEGFISVINNLGGHVYEHPDCEGSDVYGFVVSKRKLSKKQIELTKF